MIIVHRLEQLVKANNLICKRGKIGYRGIKYKLDRDEDFRFAKLPTNKPREGCSVEAAIIEVTELQGLADLRLPVP